MSPHISVFKDEMLSQFKDSHLKVFVDGTLGAGGHSEAILHAHPEIELLIGFDQDESAIALAKQRLEPFKEKVVFIHDNFRNLDEHLARLGVNKVDGFFLT